MKQYLLLRDNRQSGPHTIEQLGSIGLGALDLIWIENESTSWQYSGDIEELKELVKQDPSQMPGPVTRRQASIFVSLPSNFYQKNRQDSAYSMLPVNESDPVLETNYARPLEELKENYRALRKKQPVWKKKLFPSAQAVRVTAVFLGVITGAFIIKNWVEGYVPSSPEPTATAMPVTDPVVEQQPDENLKSALVTEIVPVFKNTPAKITKKPNLKKQLRLSTNAYKVGLFGGINGLQLTVFNTSPQMVDKVIVALDYLRPNGIVVQSEHIAFTDIKPKGAQTIAIPGSSRGVKVRYKIVKVHAREYKAHPKQI